MRKGRTMRWKRSFKMCAQVQVSSQPLPEQSWWAGYSTCLLQASPASKHEGFGEEREWRVIYSPNRVRSDLVDPSIETVGGVPQVVHRLPLDAARSEALADLDLYRMLDRLIIGPSSYPWVMYDAFIKALSAAGMTDAHNRVVVSGIPIRS